ncbi:toxin-antitoxin system YwqK family antitoxin [Flavobacterium sp.]|uniref:toxin-antitoxin system YwqK family antitoxin n=1 Tax=Flavobacterium sp. TaxID=239 RepID=UPI004048CF8D
MKNNMCFLFFLLGNMTLHAQEIIYKPIFINQCTNEEEKNVIWDIIDLKQKKFLKKEPFDVEVLLPSLGVYELIYNINVSERIEIKKTETTTDTVFLEKLKLSVAISNPPFSEYIVCNTLANGRVTDYYSNGKIRAIGTFENGQLTDTLKKYDNEGVLTELQIPNKKGNRLLDYYKDGKIKVDLNYRKKQKKIYYESGKLAEYKSWKGKIKLVSYFENGTLKRLRSPKKQEIFSKKEILVDIITRKEILKIERLFSFHRKDKNHRYYEYHWVHHDKKGAKKHEIVYYESNYSVFDFPDSIQQINQTSFDIVTFYKESIPYKKIEAIYLNEENNYSKQLIVYRKENEDWIEEERHSIDTIYSLIEEFTAH